MKKPRPKKNPATLPIDAGQVDELRRAVLHILKITKHAGTPAAKAATKQATYLEKAKQIVNKHLPGSEEFCTL